MRFDRNTAIKNAWVIGVFSIGAGFGAWAAVHTFPPDFDERTEWQQDAIGWLSAGLDELGMTSQDWEGMSPARRDQTVEFLVQIRFVAMGLDYDDLLMNSGLDEEGFREWMIGCPGHDEFGPV